MTVRRFKKLAILAKLEATSGTDSAPLAANAIIAKNVTFTPLEGTEVQRDLILPWLGNQGMVLAGGYARIEFEVELAGAGAAGTVPKYDPLLRACGLAAVAAAGVSVTYSFVEEGQQSASLYFIMDKTRHVMLFSRGNCALAFNAKGIPVYRLTLLGLLGTISDIASMPAVSKTGWVDGLVVSKANTVLTLHGNAVVAESLSIDFGNTVTPRFLIGAESVEITDRISTGTAVVEAKPIADVDWFAKAIARTRGAMSMIHGVAAGNIVEVQCAVVEIGRPTIGQTDNIANYSLPLGIVDETALSGITIIVR